MRISVYTRAYLYYRWLYHDACFYLDSDEMKIPPNELALAYELRTEGVCWKRIGIGLGYDWQLIKDSVESAERGGLHDRRVLISADKVSATEVMRSNGLGYGCIARYLGVDRKQLQYAMWNHRARHGAKQIGEK